MGFLADFKRMAESGNYKKNKDSLLDSPLVTINVDGQPMEGRNQSFSKGGKFLSLMGKLDEKAAKASKKKDEMKFLKQQTKEKLQVKSV